MKRYIKTGLLAFCLTMLVSCERFLDVPEGTNLGLTEESLLADYQSIRGFLDNSYAALQDIHDWNTQGFSRNNVNACSDEAASLFQQAVNTTINSGNWLDRNQAPEIGFQARTGSTLYNRQNPVMASSIIALRIVNTVIEKIDRVPNLTAAQKDELLGQAYFMRAWHYFQLITRWGGMPILDKAYTSDDDVNLPRVTYHESHDWMMQDIEKAITLLPENWPASERGRATKMAAMAFRAMAALYDASPLMQNDLTSIAVKPYDTKRCETAAQFGIEAIRYLEQAQSKGLPYRLMAGSEYTSIFYHFPNLVSDESLWYNNDAGARDNRRGIRCHYVPVRFSGGTGNDAASFNPPTQNLIDKFEVLNNGKAYPINHPQSGYDAQNPWVNRDPRFYKTIIVPGETWGVDASGNKLYMELYVGGTDYDLVKSNTNTKDRTSTGYALKKFWWPEGNQFTNNWTYKVNTVFIRAAQLYLDYAEAMNEAYGPTSDPKGYGLTAVEAINIVRRRVGMPDVLPEYTSSKEVFRERVRNERSIELLFENHRWFDIRRWMIAEDLFKAANPIFGINATPVQANHKTIADKSTLTYKYETFAVPTEIRVFQTRHYWYPVPRNHTERWLNFKQNPGW